MSFVRQSIVELNPLYNERECATVIDWTERQGFAPWPTGSEVPTLSRCVADDRLRGDLWYRLAGAIETAVGRTPVQYAGATVIDRFEVGQRLFSEAGDWSRCSRWQESPLTVVVFLNEGFVGGEMVCYPADAPLPVMLRAGGGLIYPVFLTCEELPVRQGRKYALRTTVALNGE